MSSEQRPKGIHEERRDDLAVYALGALPVAEADEMRAHLRDCSACSSHVEWLQRGVDLLPASALQLQPPPGLKKSLMAEVKADAKRERRSARAKRGWRGVLLRPAIGLAASAVLIAGAVVGYELQPDGGSGPTSTITAKPTSEAKGVTMSATLVRSGSSGRLHVDHLPQLPGSTVYQTWLAKGGKLVPSTPFVVRKDGTNEVAIDGDLDTANAVFVTTEPQGGSMFPTTEPILRANLK